MKQDLADMAALLPEDGMAKLFTGEECVLCKGEKGKREYYAFSIWGIPVRASTGRRGCWAC